MSSGVTERKNGPRILVVRLSAMGDVVHALPAVASLKHSFPGSEITWVVAAKWAPLLRGNVFVDRIVEFDRRSLTSILRVRREVRSRRHDVAIDFQGLIQSALIAASARAERVYGYHRSQVRERPAAFLYSNAVAVSAVHIVDRHLELARAAGAGNTLITFPLPEGAPEDPLPEGDFVLACPLAGWTSKQWPLEFYNELAGRLYRELGVPLVVNGPPSALDTLSGIPEAQRHLSGLPGLIYATRRAAAVLGVDSGPLHLAAALGKPGVALFGPTDPQRNGPYGGSMTVLRAPGAVTTYRRGAAIDASMRALTPAQVFEGLKTHLARESRLR